MGSEMCIRDRFTYIALEWFNEFVSVFNFHIKGDNDDEDKKNSIVRANIMFLLTRQEVCMGES